MKCPNCGHKWESKPYVFLKGHRCRMCASDFQSSYPEQAILFYAKKYFGDDNVISRYLVNGKKNLELDVFLKKKILALNTMVFTFIKTKFEKIYIRKKSLRMKV